MTNVIQFIKCSLPLTHKHKASMVATQPFGTVSTFLQATLLFFSSRKLYLIYLQSKTLSRSIQQL
jgi:hypothetical protein